MERNRILVTVRLATEKVLKGLKEFSTCDQARFHIGHSSNSVKIRDAAAVSMQRVAAGIVKELEAALGDDARCCSILRRYNNNLSNMDGHRYYWGPWAHVAQMVGMGCKYVIGDDVLAEAPKPGRKMTWNGQTWLYHTGDWAWDDEQLTWVWTDTGPAEPMRGSPFGADDDERIKRMFNQESAT